MTILKLAGEIDERPYTVDSRRTVKPNIIERTNTKRAKITDIADKGIKSFGSIKIDDVS